MSVNVRERYEYDSSTQATPVHTLFGQVSTDRLTADHLLGLGAGVIGALHVRNFFSAEQCGQIIDGLDRAEMGSYDFTPPIAKLGPAAYDFYKTGELGDRYFEQAERDATARSGLMGGKDPLAAAMRHIGDAWGLPVVPATSGGRPMFAGMIREINNGARMHFDEIVRECPSAMDRLPVCQLAFNCFLSVPDAGGAGVVYRRRWRPADEDHRDGYGYSVALVEGEPEVSSSPEVGDAMLFDPRNYHLVEPCGGGRRVTLSFFLGITGSGPLIVWS